MKLCHKPVWIFRVENYRKFSRKRFYKLILYLRNFFLSDRIRLCMYGVRLDVLFDVPNNLKQYHIMDPHWLAEFAVRLGLESYNRSMFRLQTTRFVIIAIIQRIFVFLIYLVKKNINNTDTIQYQITFPAKCSTQPQWWRRAANASVAFACII